MTKDRKDRDKTVGQQQGNLPEDVDRDVPAEGGIGQTGQRDPARPGNKGVDQPKPGQG